jgi:hypothetical protein
MTKARLLLVRLFMTTALVSIGSSLTWISEANAQLRLSEAVQEAVEKNPEIKLLRQRLDVVSARAKQAPYLEDPEIAFQRGGVPLSNPIPTRLVSGKSCPSSASSVLRKKLRSRK